MHGTAYANYAVHHCDLLIAVGARFDDRVTGKLDTFAPERQGDPHRHRPGGDRQERATPTCPIVGDCQDGPAGAAATGAEPRRRRRGWPQIAEWKARVPARAIEQPGERSCPQQCDRRDLRGARTARPIVRTDVGQHQMWAAQYYCSRRRASASPRAGSARWASACRRPSARSSAGPDKTVWSHHGRRLLPDDVQELTTAAQIERCRSRSRSSTTATWAWCASGRRCSTIAATRTRISMTTPTSSSWPRPTGSRGSGASRPEELRRRAGAGRGHAKARSFSTSGWTQRTTSSR